MGFFDKLFSGTGSTPKDMWTPLQSNEEVEEVIKASGETAQVILKHSTSCGTSFFAKRHIEGLQSKYANKVGFSIIDVIRSRSVSEYLAKKFGIRHESPQVFVIKKGEVIWNGSHSHANSGNVSKALDSE